VLKAARYPSGLQVETAWLGIYQVLLWHEPVNMLGFGELPHIIDADKLRPSNPAKRRTWTKAKPWQKHAQAVEEYVAKQLGIRANEVPKLTDGLMKLPDFEGMQRQNSLGIAFAGLVQYVLEKFGSDSLSYETEVEATEVFPGIDMAGRSETPRIDILVKRDDMPRAIISTKWSVRHDRLSDITNEGPIYKAAYNRIYRQQRRDTLLYYVMTNEYDPSRLNKMLDDSGLDGVVHVHKPAVVQVCGLNGRLVRLIDLADFVKLTHSW